MMNMMNNIKYKLKCIFYYPFQRLFLGYSDNQLWNIDYELQKWLLPKLVAFRKNIHSHPFEFIEYDEHCGMTKERYSELKEKGEIVGGGLDGWKNAIDEMIFSFIFRIYDEYGRSTKLEKKLIKELITTPYGDVREYIVSGDLKFVPIDEEGKYVRLDTSDWVIDQEKENKMKELRERAHKGYEIFGKYWMNLWD